MENPILSVMPADMDDFTVSIQQATFKLQILTTLHSPKSIVPNNKRIIIIMKYLVSENSNWKQR